MKRVQGKFLLINGTDLSKNLQMSIGTGFIFDLGGFLIFLSFINIIELLLSTQTGNGGIQFEFE
ncbi:MAG: hypothetical protein CM1200mP1_08240 [Candidatus Neomarinimicrobiota bacterium]|nr:MAG: hypothetical protein CM1200mP1_08240 [Candidatus Neomarinimicrobiota bacterium]